MSSAGSVPHGVLVVDKPEGPTSHDIVARARRLLSTRRVGHTGTLDPMATGVLVLCVGTATRLARFLAAADKTYVGRLRLGWETDTLDRTGRPLTEPRPAPENLEEVTAAMQGLVGRRLQHPPAFSAKRIDGIRAYRMARQGVPRIPSPALVVIREFRLLALDGADLQFEVSCSSGTYIRVLAQELGRALRCGAHLTSLRRTVAGEFGLEQARTLVELQDLAALGRVRDALLPNAMLLLGMPGVQVDATDARLLSQGGDLHPEEVLRSTLAGASWCRVLGADGTLLGLAQVEGDGGRLRPRIVLVPPPAPSSALVAPAGTGH